MKILLASPRGFCAGVERAISIVEKALLEYGPPVYVKHEIVHNQYVVNDLKKKGAVFVEAISQIPNGGITIFSAHGVSKKVEDDANLKDLPIIDATCPLVTKVHLEAIKNENKGYEIILIGHHNHPEVEGTSGRIKGAMLIVSNITDIKNLQVKDPNNLAYITQTTLSVDETKEIIAALKQKYPNISGPDVKNICYATQNRQNAVKELAKYCDVILVIGSSNSSNSNRLRDLAEDMGVESYLINSYSDIKEIWLTDKENIGITAGASAPEILVQEVIDFIQNKYNASIEELITTRENIIFKLPKLLQDA